jgi:hypothetical protein
MFDASVLSTPLVIVCALCIVVHHLLVPPFVQFDVVCASCHEKYCRCVCAIDALFTNLLRMIVVYHSLVPPFVHFVKVCARCQFELL